MLACFWATKRLRTFLWGRHFNLRTDHKPLVNVLTTKGSASERTSHRINKWSARMLEYNFNVTYVQGVNNVMADCLSRLPVAAQPDEYSHDSKNDECIARIDESTPGANSVNELKTATRDDGDMQLAARYMTSKWPARKTLSAILQALYDVSDELSINDELLHRGDLIVIPETITCDTTGARRTFRHDAREETTTSTLLVASYGPTRGRRNSELPALRNK